MNTNNSHSKRLALVLISALLLGILPSGRIPASRAATDTPGEPVELSNPTTDSDGVTTWDCITFGNYWQDDTNGDGKADKDDDKQPIKWRVLSVDSDDAFLLADMNLDGMLYNEEFRGVTWETCTLRSWLNGYGADSNVCEKDYTSDNFINNAFSESECAGIIDTNVVTADNPLWTNSVGGRKTKDKVYLLSIDEVLNPSYGFISDGDTGAESRRAKNTEYTKEQGTSTNESDYVGNGIWWLRTPGFNNNRASQVSFDGSVSNTGIDVNYFYIYSVRPALHLDLSSDSGWLYAGTVTSEVPPVESEEPDETQKPSETPSTAVTEEPTDTASPVPTKSPSVTEEPSETVNPVPTDKPDETQKPSETPSTSPVGTNPSQSGQTAVTPPQGLAPAVPTVTPGDSSVSPKIPGKVANLKLKGKKKAIQASWKKVSGANGYEICYSTSAKWKNKKVKTTKQTKLTIGKLKSKKTYYIRVRAYTIQNGKKVYGKWSKTAKKKVK